MVTDTDYDNLDAKGLEVLEAIYETGGEANTSEIKEYTGIEKNAIIHYRYDRLEDAGLITTRTGEATGARVPPKVAVLTDEGKEQIAAGLFDSEDSTIVERMDRLERQFGAVVDQFRNVEQEVRQFRYDGETDEEVTAVELIDRIEELSELSEEIEEFTRFVPDHGWLTRYRRQWHAPEGDHVYFTLRYRISPANGDGCPKELVSNMTFRNYLPDQVERFATMAGLLTEAVYGNYEKRPYREGDARVIYLLRKP
jgi:DNA-binding MarR family transcriptional regulator